MQRRTFIRNSALALGALSFPFGETRGSATIAAAPKTFRKSIMWGTVGVEGSVLDKCKAVKAAGFDGIQPNSHMNRQEVIAAMKATGLVASSVCCSTHWNKPLSDPSAAVRQEGMDGAIVALEDAAAYGTDAILLVPGTVSDAVGYDECWERSTACIKQLVPKAEKLKVTICIENVWNNFLLSPMEAARYVDQFKSDRVKFYFDCGNILAFGFPDQWIRILDRRVGRIHIKEYSRTKADKEGRWAGFDVALTEGDVPWKQVMAQTRAHYRADWLTTEQGGGSTPQGLKDLCSRLDKIIAM
jgi:hexulose-6-phosphate isomerase